MASSSERDAEVTRHERLRYWFARIDPAQGVERQRLLDLAAQESSVLRAELDELLGGTAPADGELEAAARYSAAVGRMRSRRSPERAYRPIRPLGLGGIGAVLEVEDPVLGRRLALKHPLPETASPGVFAREALILAKLHHPGVVPIYDFGVDDEEEPFFVMGQVDGRHLGQALQDVRREDCQEWTVSRALHIVLRAAETVAYAHSLGIVHRDLKPANILVGTHGEVRVGDWGAASAPGVDDVAVLGTEGYMDPQQAAGQRVGPAADVHAFGILVLEVATGSVRRPRQLTRAQRRRVPAELLSICDHATALDPAARYANASEFANDLRAYLDGRVVRAHAVGWRAELRKWWQRNQPWSGGMVGGIVATFSIVLWFWFGAVAARQELVTRDAASSQLVARLGRSVPSSLLAREFEPFADSLASANSQLHTNLVEMMGDASVDLKLIERAKQLRDHLLRLRETAFQQSSAALTLRNLAEARIKWADLEDPVPKYSAYLEADREIDEAMDRFASETADDEAVSTRGQSTQLVDDKIWSLVRLANRNNWGDLPPGAMRAAARDLQLTREQRALDLSEKALRDVPAATQSSNLSARLHTYVEVHGRLCGRWLGLPGQEVVQRTDRLRENALKLSRLAPGDCSYQMSCAIALGYVERIRRVHGAEYRELVEGDRLLQSKQERFDAAMRAHHLNNTRYSASTLRKAATDLGGFVVTDAPGRARALVRRAIPLSVWPPGDVAQIPEAKINPDLLALAKRLGVR